MDEVASPADEQTLISSFLAIAVDESPDTARQFLQASSWKLEEAIQLFYTGNEGGLNAAYKQFAPVESEVLPARSSLSTNQGVGGDNIRQGHEEPVIRDVLYDHAVSYRASRVGGGLHETHSVVPFRNSREQMKRSGVWELENKSASTADDSRDYLAAFYPPPDALMYRGTFKNAKDAAYKQNKWLLVNLQSTREFSSRTLNRNTWADEVVAQTIKTNFIFWQVYDDTEEGSKVCTYYKLDSIPVVLVINPVTDQKMWCWAGMIEPHNLLEDLSPYMDDSPKDHPSSLAHKRDSHSAPTRHVPDERVDEDLARAMAASIIITPPTYPPLPRQPAAINAFNRNLFCRVGMRLPYGQRIWGNFLLSDPIQLLWSLCLSELEEEDKTRPFLLKLPIPGGSAIPLDYNTPKTFEEAGLANHMISATWK